MGARILTPVGRLREMPIGTKVARLPSSLVQAIPYRLIAARLPLPLRPTLGPRVPLQLPHRMSMRTITFGHLDWSEACRRLRTEFDAISICRRHRYPLSTQIRNLGKTTRGISSG